MSHYFVEKCNIKINQKLNKKTQKNVRKSIDKIKSKIYNKTKQKIANNLFDKKNFLGGLFYDINITYKKYRNNR